MRALTTICLFIMGISMALAESDLQKVIAGLPERGDGAFLRRYPNGFRIFGVGTAIVDDKDDPEALLRSEEIANLAARKAMSAYLSQTVSANTEMQKSFEKAETVNEAEGIATRDYQKMSLQTFSQEMSSGTENILRGVVTVKKIQFERNGHLMSRVLVAYSSKTLNMLQEAQIASDTAVISTPASQPPVSDSTIQAPEIQREEWLLCVGRGTTRELAVKAAVIEGIQQVYGAYIENNETYKKRFEKVVRSRNLALQSGTDNQDNINNNPPLGQSAIHIQKTSTEHFENTLSQTKGFVDTYRIVSITEVASGLEATIKAKFVNPRSGGLKAVMIYPMDMPISKYSNVYEIAPKKRISGAELRILCQRQFERAFAKTNKYIILNQGDISEAVNQNNLTKEMASSDLVSPAELSKIGKMLTADFVITSQFGDIKYSRKMGMNKATKKLENIERIVFTFDYAIIEVATGETRKQNTVNVIVPNEAIKQVRQINEDIPEEECTNRIFDLVMNTAVEQLSQEAKF